MTTTDGAVPVNVLNFVRAETDHYFDSLLAQSGRVNRWRHHREPASIDEQAEAAVLDGSWSFPDLGPAS